jgi:5-methyltetrahydropteroyltriglutamate--homocysteine methyltransferase
MTFKLPSRADHVGSFLRPQAVIEARAARAAGTLDAAGLRQVEDAAIAELVAWEEGLGLKAITDGEFRRYFFHTDFLLQLAGVEERGGMAKAFKNDAGKDVQFAPPVMVVNGKVAHKAPIQRADYEYLAGRISAPGAMAKVAIPSPSMLHFRAGRSGIPESVYPLMEDFYNDVASAYRQEIASLANAMCRWTIPILPICATTNSAKRRRRAGWTPMIPPANTPG